MSISNEINGSIFKDMVSSAANWLNNKREEVDRLNVFPVPDGDTGTNMAMTMKSSAKFVLERAADDTVGELAQQMAYGALMGARGNSGVILSQILSGFASAVAHKDVIGVKELIAGFSAGADAAYNAVSNPMEGTVLTIVREASEALSRMPIEDLTTESALEYYLKEGYASLQRTPELLPVLKQAGVVDAGAQGFLFIVEGFQAALKGKPVSFVPEEPGVSEDLNDNFDHFFTDPEAIKFPYCTEFLINAKGHILSDVIDQVKGHLSGCGDCMLVVGAGQTVKVHIHTDNLGSVLGFVSQFGELNDIKINNMREQNRELQAQGVIEEKEYAIVTVSNGDGLVDIFKSLGATNVIYGGQTMNPSTQDFLDVIDGVHARKVLILPNNKNIIMAAEQAAKLTDDIDVQVVPSRTIPQGLAALMAFSPDVDLTENIDMMTEDMTLVSSGEITNAVRDTEIDGIEIKKDQFMAILDGRIVAAVDGLKAALHELVKRMVENDAGLITLYYGQDVTESAVEALVDDLASTYDAIDFEHYEGGQLVYPFIVSAE